MSKDIDYMKTKEQYTHEIVRGLGQKIRVNDDIEFVVVRVTGDTVRIGIDAPREIAVHRREVYDRIKNSEPKISS